MFLFQIISKSQGLSGFMSFIDFQNAEFFTNLTSTWTSHVIQEFHYPTGPPHHTLLVLSLLVGSPGKSPYYCNTVILFNQTATLFYVILLHHHTTYTVTLSYSCCHYYTVTVHIILPYWHTVTQMKIQCSVSLF